MISIIVLAIVFVLIAVRQIGKFRLGIWQIMLSGAAAVLVTGQISISNVLNSINIDVILFLFGMFVVGRALEESGYLSHLAYLFFRKAKTLDALILFILFGAGILSAFLMNDTLAIIGTPVILLLAEKHKISAKVLLLTLAFAITTGSVMSPIGNPQNLLIAIHGNVSNSFVSFFEFLAIPTLINLVLAFFIIKIFFREHFHDEDLNHSSEPILDFKLAKISQISLMILILLIIVKIAMVYLGKEEQLKLTYIALISALPIILFSKRRIEIIKKIDWHTLIFFAAMFVLMQSVWGSGYFQKLISSMDVNITTVFMILIISVLLSQLISNVPLVALYLPLLLHLGVSTKGMMALAAGSTIAGNLFILGAASNIIIIQNAEKRKGETLTFLEFAKVGIPLTVLNAAVYYFYLKIL
ncbi:MAG: SLC13 family permease [Bacteroidetes bacterium]|nr:SLC13 family permease [Bacteroidota bacterium]